MFSKSTEDRSCSINLPTRDHTGDSETDPDIQHGGDD